MVCNKQLSTGEELYVIDENKFVCKDDYLSSASLKEGSLNSGRGRAGGWGREVGAETTLQSLVSQSLLPDRVLIPIASSSSHFEAFSKFNPHPHPFLLWSFGVVSSSTGRPLKAEDGEMTCWVPKQLASGDPSPQGRPLHSQRDRGGFRKALQRAGRPRRSGRCGSPREGYHRVGEEPPQPWPQSPSGSMGVWETKATPPDRLQRPADAAVLSRSAVRSVLLYGPQLVPRSPGPAPRRSQGD